MIYFTLSCRYIAVRKLCFMQYFLTVVRTILFLMVKFLFHHTLVLEEIGIQLEDEEYILCNTVLYLWHNRYKTVI